MADMDMKSIGTSLDMICKKLYEKAEPIGVCNLDAWCDYDISDKVALLGKMVDGIWRLEMKFRRQEREWNRTDKLYVEKIKSLEMERDQHFQRWVDAEKKIEELERLLHGYQKRPYVKQDMQVYFDLKTKRGNQNARRKDIDPIEVYRLVKGGMSITKVAEKYHASRATIRKYYIAGENECSDNEE